MDALLALHGHATVPLDALLALTALSLAPFLIMMMTSFVRITVVLSLVRSAIGASALPPNAVITGLALILTSVVMAPTVDRILHEGVLPYTQGRISSVTAVQRMEEPLRRFMLRQTPRRDLELFAHALHRPIGETVQRMPLTAVIPAFVVNELRNGFGIGFALYLPFVVIDLVVASLLMGLGMMMLSPSVVSLPCKLFLFVAVDGWALVCTGLITSFRS